MNSKVLVAVFAVLALFASGIVLTFDGSDAADDVWVDPNYRDPPAADYVIEIEKDLSFKSNDVEYTYYILSQDAHVDDDSFDGVSADSQDDMAQFVKSIRNLGTSGIHTVIDDVTKDGWTDACVPEWINAEVIHEHELFGSYEHGLSITIIPALQALEVDTHGDYWIYYSMTQSGPGMSQDITKTFLFEFSVDVEYVGSVIPDVESIQFVLKLDYGNGYVETMTPVTVGANVTSTDFVLPTEGPERDGYKFKGFAVELGGDLLEGSAYTVSINDVNVEVSENESGQTVYTATLFALWEPVNKEDGFPTLLGTFLSLCLTRGSCCSLLRSCSVSRISSGCAESEVIEMVVWFIPVVSAIGSALYLWLDYETSKDIAESTSQMESYIDLLNGVMGIDEFLANAWPSLLLFGGILLVGYLIATPQRRKVRRVRRSRQ